MLLKCKYFCRTLFATEWSSLSRYLSLCFWEDVGPAGLLATKRGRWLVGWSVVRVLPFAPNGLVQTKGQSSCCRS
ncbi:unnamed protein product [Amoebophrya sp. A120]|nr:unnamed protein product [Amoebophrya sp. A120]|eukprot:GSA120T00009623001.1